MNQRDKRPRKQLTNRQYYKSLIDYKPEAALLVDAEGDIMLSNAAFESLSGFNDNILLDLIARQLFLVYPNESNPFDMKQLRDFNASMFLLTANHNLQKVSVETSEIEGQKYLCIVKPVDNTETKASSHSPEIVPKIEKPAEVLKPKVQTVEISKIEEWTSEQQHEIRTALNGIMGFSSVLMKEQLDPKLQTYISGIYKNSHKLKKLVDSKEDVLVPFQRNLNLSVVEPSALIGKIRYSLEEAATENELTFDVQTETNIRMLTDTDRLERVLRYLMEKAVKFCRSELIKIKVVKNSDSHSLDFSIDNIGLDFPSQLTQWLEQQQPPYETESTLLKSHPEIRKLLLELNTLSTSISFKTGTDMGEIVTLNFKPYIGENSVDVEKELMDEIKVKNPSILIVEDDKINAQVLKLYLKEVANVVVAYTGNEAINLIQQQINNGQTFHLVLMDIGLPEPWNGVTLKSEISRNWINFQSVPFVAQTAYIHQEWTTLIESGSFAGILMKPIKRMELLFMISKLLK
ncbi:MAG: PAS/PAC sensor hybrid histidine kinase [Bacteroidetes bacterium]|nr:MAG: PAS/PAC sensor hybrid histidine kinase [Bacteroidota bacterium]